VQRQSEFIGKMYGLFKIDKERPYLIML